MKFYKVYEALASELGVEIGEKFNIVGSINSPFVIEKDGIECITDAYYDVSNLMNMIENGCKIEKLPWEPKENEMYYYPVFDCLELHDYDYWNCHSIDSMIKNTVGIYKTKEEAVKKAFELWGLKPSE